MSKKLIIKQNNLPGEIYQNAENIGTEELSSDDLNMPILKIIQPNTQEIENKQDGFFYRSELKEQYETIKVNFVYVTTELVDNYNKTAKEKVKIYYGFYAGTIDPFRIYFRGWAMADHRNFQTEIMAIKNKYKIPMLALTIILSTYKQSGIIQDTGKPYTSYRPLFTIEKKDDNPIIEMNPERISILVQAAEKFKEIAATPSINDMGQNAIEEKEEKYPFK